MTKAQRYALERIHDLGGVDSMQQTMLRIRQSVMRSLYDAGLIRIQHGRHGDMDRYVLTPEGKATLGD